MLLIPSILHQIWLGWKPLPAKFQEFQKTWVNIHKDWQYYNWNESNIWNLQYINLVDFNKLYNYSEKSDYLRFCILLEYGWVYIDTDVECLRDITPLLQNYTFFISSNLTPSLNSAIMGSIPKQRIIKSVFESFSSRINEKKWNKYDSNEKIWPEYLNEFFKKISLGNTEVIFPPEIFEPIHWKYFSGGELKQPRINFNLSWSYAIHHFDAHWISPSFKFKKYIYNMPFLWTLASRTYHLLKKYAHK